MPSPFRSSLHLMSFDASGKQVANWLLSYLQDWPVNGQLWLLLEQMHRFDFKGPDLKDLWQVITEESLATFGLRGRLFWGDGQIEWRRLEDSAFRVVSMVENAMPLAAPAGIEACCSHGRYSTWDRNLILWGTSKNREGQFRELRVAGSQEIEYPAALTESAAKLDGPVELLLRARGYIDEADGIECFRRFRFPEVRKTKSASVKRRASTQPQRKGMI